MRWVRRAKTASEAEKQESIFGQEKLHFLAAKLGRIPGLWTWHHLQVSSSPAHFIWLNKAITDKAVYSKEDRSERNWYCNWWATFLPLYMRCLCQKWNRLHAPAKRNNTHKPHQLLCQKVSLHLWFYSLLKCPSTSTCPICHTLQGQHVHKPMSRLSSSICRFFPTYGGYSIDNSLKLITNPDIIWFVINASQPMSLSNLHHY